MENKQTDEALAHADRELLEAYSMVGDTIAVSAHLGRDVKGINIQVSQPRFQAAFRRFMALELQGHGAAAIALCRRVVDDSDAPVKIRLDAAKFLASIAGYVAPKAQAMKRATDSPAEMTSAELRAFVQQAERELASRAAPVNAQVMPDTASQAVDMLE